MYRSVDAAKSRINFKRVHLVGLPLTIKQSWKLYEIFQAEPGTVAKTILLIMYHWGKLLK